jgi:hypothetical protein
MVPFSRSITCAASAGSSASGAIPARCKKRYRWRPKRGRERKRVACGRGSLERPRANELVEGLRNPERLEGIDLLVENARKLQREERIPARPLVHAEQRLASRRTSRGGRAEADAARRR